MILEIDVILIAVALYKFLSCFVPVDKKFSDIANHLYLYLERIVNVNIKCKCSYVKYLIMAYFI
jgi:hypothetical protein